MRNAGNSAREPPRNGGAIVIAVVSMIQGLNQAVTKAILSQAGERR